MIPFVRLAAAVGAAAAVAGVLLPGAAAALPYDPSGPRLTGGANSGSAVELKPGVHVDSLAEGAETAAARGATRYYAIQVPAGATPYVAVTIAAPAQVEQNVSLGLKVSLTAGGASTTCESRSDSDWSSDRRLDPVTVVAAPGPAGGEDGCPAGALAVAVERTGDAAVDDALRIEIAFRLEPRALEPAGSGPASPAGNVLPDLIGPPAALTSARSFADAPVLAAGNYTDTLRANDIRIVRVHLEWGQRFGFTFTGRAVPGLASGRSLRTEVAVADPVRRGVALATGSGTSAVNVGNQEAVMSGSTLVPVRFANRRSGDDEVARYSLAGDYYLVISSDTPSEGGDPAVRYTLKVQVFGTAERGPEYGTSVSSSSSSSGGATSSGRTAATEGETGTPVGTILAVVAGAAVLTGLVVVLLALVRRMRDPARGQTRRHT